MKTCRYSLTATAVANAKAKAKPYKLADGGGLYLWISATAAKSWRYDYRLHGASRTFSIGKFPDVSLSDARSAHQRARATVAAGEHPIDARRDVERRQQIEFTSTFERVATEWHEAKSSRLSAPTQRQVIRELRKHVLPSLGSRQITRITRAEIAFLVKQLDARIPEVARNCRSYISSIFEYAINNGLIENDPTPPRKILRVRNPRSHLAARGEEMGELLHKLSLGKQNRQTEIAFRLLAITLLRKSEVVEAEWSEVDLEARRWRIPKDRKKERREFVVTLPTQACLLLRELRTISNGRFLFPNRVDPLRPMANRTLNAYLERNGLSTITKVHGLRSTASTYLNELNPAKAEIVEYALAHAVGSNVKRIYDRGDRELQRAELLQEWADFLELAERRAKSIVNEKVAGQQGSLPVPT